MRKTYRLRTITILILLLTLVMNIISPLMANAQNSNNHKVVRVGWHEPPFFMTDQYGRKSGYSYEYQIKVAAYTDWEYEYVEGTFSELLQMLKNGEIDLLSDVSYSEERSKEMLFSSLSMGKEVYYVYVPRDCKDIRSDDISSLNGKTIGVAKGSIQKDYFLAWEESHGIKANLVEMNTTEEDSLRLLGSKLDAFVTLDVYGTADTVEPVCKIGSSDFYFAVSKDRSDLLLELDEALNKIQDENKYFDQQLHTKYLKSTETQRYLSTQAKDWLTNHGKIRIGYQDSYLAFCAQDPYTGELTGALKDYLEYASNAFENAKIEFEAVCYPTAAAAIEALKKGEIDCMFPANLSSFDAEQNDLLMTPPIMNTEMDAVVRASEQKEFLQDDNVVVAVNEGNTNYDLFLADNYPTWERKYFKDTPTGLEAVANKEADCVIISNYRFNNIAKQCDKLHLTTVYTGVDMDYYIAVRKGDIQLYSILAMITDVVPASTVQTALTYYSTEDAKTSFVDILKENIFIVTTVASLVLFIILILVLFGIRAEKKVREGKSLVNALNRRVFVDALTSVRNKGAFTDYIGKLQDRVDSGEQFEFAIGIFDCNDLKQINDQYGHDKGDIYLKTACQLICKVFDHSPVFRIGGDEFAAVLMNNDFKNRDQLVEQFEKRRKEICNSAENKWEEVHIALGIAVYDSKKDKSVDEIAQRADKTMYENKRMEKVGRN